MGSRSPATISYGYGTPLKTRYSTLSVSLQNLINDNYHQRREQIIDDFKDSLTSPFAQRLAFNASKAILLHYTPIVADVYHAYQFAKVGYAYYLKVKDEYEKEPDLKSALVKGAEMEIVELAPQFAKSTLIQTMVDSTWDEYKEKQNIKMVNPVYENVIKSALSDTLEEITK